MQRFILFAGQRYEESGGMGDFVGSFSTLNKAKTFTSALFQAESIYMDWADILDTKEDIRYTRLWDENEWRESEVTDEVEQEYRI